MIYSDHRCRSGLRRLFKAVAVVICAGGLPGLGGADLRMWTSLDGRTMQAKLLSQEGGDVVFEMPSGQTTKVPLARLSAADQAYVKQNASPPGAGMPIEKRTWPDYVEVSANALEMKPPEEYPAERKYVYRSQSFQFNSQDKLAISVMKDVARTFEATRALVQALPWDINPKPPEDLGYYQARLYETHKDYVAAGGPENSGGVYFPKDRIFRIPFPSLGLELRGKTWFKKTGFKEETLVHEVTHQMMHEFLPFMPIWVTEGTAEYTEVLPYNYGKFAVKDHDRGMREFVSKRIAHGTTSAGFRSFGDQMKMKREEWMQLSLARKAQHSLYFESYLLVYYFCHLDGDGKGTRFMRYLDEIAKAHRSWAEFFKNPLVKVNPDGGFTYPANLPLPEAKHSEEFGLEKLDVLLDGRSLSQMDTEVKEAYKKVGIRL